MILGKPGPWLLLVVVASVASGQYIWNGTAWEFKGPEDSRKPVLEGSGSSRQPDYDDDEDYVDNEEGSGGPRRVEEPARPMPNLIIPAEDEEEPNVDSNNYDQSAPPKEDDFFVRNDKEDRTESPEVGQVPTNRNLPWIVAVVIGGAVLGLLFILFMVFRMRKKEKEGSNALDEPKKAHNLSEPKIIGV